MLQQLYQQIYGKPSPQKQVDRNQLFVDLRVGFLEAGRLSVHVRFNTGLIRALALASEADYIETSLSSLRRSLVDLQNRWCLSAGAICSFKVILYASNMCSGFSQVGRRSELGPIEISIYTRLLLQTLSWDE